MTSMDNDATRPIAHDSDIGASRTTKNHGNFDAPGTDAALEFSPGETILDRYKVIRLLGRGGMGSVYEVEHLFLHGRYALKFLNKNQTNDAAWRRFEIEARATNKLEHPNLIKVHDFGLLPNGQPYFIMDLVEGETLAELLKRKGRLPVDQTIKMFIQVGFALSYAHSNGIVHRDIKPSNIILTNADSGKTEDSLIKLVDFGIAKLTGQDSFNQQTLTRTGEIFGSPLYMSPEQCLGIGVDHRTDLYSLGCVMFEALTGAPPLVGDSALATMMKHQTEEPLSLKAASLGVEYPKRVEQVVSRLLTKDINARYQSAELLTADLVGLDSDQVLTAAMTALPPPAVEQGGVRLSKQVHTFLATCLFAGGVLFGYTNPQIPSKIFAVNLAREAKPDKEERHLPPIFVYNQGKDTIPLPESLAEKKVDLQFEAEAKKTTPFSELLPNNTRVFNFPNFEIGEYHAPRTPQTAPPWTVHDFEGIYFKPTLNFKKHPKLFLRFRPDDICALNVSNARTFMNLVADNLSDADEFLPFIIHLTSINYLFVADSEISEKGVKYISQLPNLKVLDLDRTTVKAEAIAKLTNLLQLEKLCVYALQDAGPIIKNLTSSKVLKTLRLVNCNVNVSQLERIASIRTLTDLDLSKNPQIGDAEMKLLPTQLLSLSVIGCPVTSNSIKQIGRLKKLRFLYLDESLWKPEQLNTLQALLPKTAIQLAKEKRRHTGTPNPEDLDQPQ